MAGAVILIAVAMFLDEQREFDSALLDLRDEQTALATAVGADFEARLQSLRGNAENLGGDDTRALLALLLGGALELQQPRSRIILVLVPGRGLLDTTGRRVRSDRLLSALSSRQSSLILSRAEAAAVGLPERIAVAGLRDSAAVERGWGVVVLASAERLRTRERHAQLRFLLGLITVTSLVSIFGGLALRDQRRRLEAARELEVAALRTESERLLAEADKMATLAALSSGIAHQIATPLGTIVARVEQVVPAVSHLPKATTALNVVAEQVQRIQRIIHGVLDLARGNRPTLVKTRPEAILHATLSLVQHRIAEARVSAEVLVAEGVPGIACDPPMLEQALANLVLNACDASAPRTTIWIRLEQHDGNVVFVVEDEGEGISPEIAGRALEPFFTTKSREHGTGLGLPIAHEVVANHGGRLTLESRPGGRGTRATIEIPAAA